MTNGGRIDAAAALHRLHLAAVEPLLIAARKRRRLAAFGIAGPEELPSGSIDFSVGACPQGEGCAAVVAIERRYLTRYLSDFDAPFGLWRLRGVPAMIDLGLYPGLPAYQLQVRRHSKGGVLRQVRRAAAGGFACRIFAADFHRRERFAIDASKRVRSGLVLASLLRRPPASDFPAGIAAADVAAYLGSRAAGAGPGLPRPPPPPCPLHWNIDWGVFASEDGAERLVGYIRLRRTGNLVRTTGLMGHGDYLSQHVMKLLFHEVMAWLLARADPAVRGLDYLLYGAVEHGNDGLAAWKRSFGFMPMALRWPR